MLGQLLLDGVFLADQHELDAKLLSRKQSALDHDSWGVVSAHRIDSDFRHGKKKVSFL
ncbi:MAG: hypothetical protein HW419_4511 [Deltaproteobacteria bacterium]|nr:hypothetical protein [Deltaproteobacteria bacterium]